MEKNNKKILVYIISFFILFAVALMLLFVFRLHQVSYSTSMTSIQYTESEKIIIPVTVRNKHILPLTSSNGIYLSYHIKNSDGTMIIWDGEPTEMTVPGWGEKEIELGLYAPAEAGEFIVSVDIFKDKDKWFSQYGAETLEIPLTVEAKTADQKELERLTNEIESQQIIDQNLLDELHGGSYTLEDPLIVVNPYGNSPLTALIMYTSQQEEKNHIYIHGQDQLSDVQYDFEKYETEHMIPVYGLYADTENRITLSAVNSSGQNKSVEINITTEPLIDDLKKISLETYLSDADKYQPGFNFSYCSAYMKTYKMAFDVHGDVRWYFNEVRSDQCATNYNDAKTIFLEGVYSSAYIEEYNLLGKLMRAWNMGHNIHHDIYLTDDTMILTVHEPGSTKYSDKILEVEMETGAIKTSIDYKKILQQSRDNNFGYFGFDWLHMNSVIEYDGDVIVSGNTQSTVVRNDRNGNIKWILSDPTGYLNPWKQYLLTPVGNDFEYSYNQHAVKLLPDYDGNPDTVDILLFDNGMSREYIKYANPGTNEDKYVNGPNLYSRLVHYRINEKEMTVEQIWEYGKERPELYSKWRGDADLLSNGNIMGTFNRENSTMTRFDTVYVEVDYDKNVIWECLGCSQNADNNYQDYRCDRIEIYADTAQDLKIGQTAEFITAK